MPNQGGETQRLKGPQWPGAHIFFLWDKEGSFMTVPGAWGRGLGNDLEIPLEIHIKPWPRNTPLEGVWIWCDLAPKPAHPDGSSHKRHWKRHLSGQGLRSPGRGHTGRGWLPSGTPPGPSSCSASLCWNRRSLRLSPVHTEALPGKGAKASISTEYIGHIVTKA